MIKQKSRDKSTVGRHVGFLAVLSLLFFTLTANSEVFSLFPFGHGGKMWGVDALGGSKLWTEPVEVNGIALKMRVTLQKQTLNELFDLLKHKFPKASFKHNSESLLVEIPRLNGMVERIYLIAIKGKTFSTIQFSLELPPNMPKSPEWLDLLPIPAGASPIETMAMPNRELAYGVFSTNISPGAAIAEMTGTMISKGWVEIQNGVMASKEKKRIMLFTVSENEKGKTTGFVLSRPLLGTKIK